MSDKLFEQLREAASEDRKSAQHAVDELALLRQVTSRIHPPQEKRRWPQWLGSSVLVSAAAAGALWVYARSPSSDLMYSVELTAGQSSNREVPAGAKAAEISIGKDDTQVVMVLRPAHQTATKPLVSAWVLRGGNPEVADGDLRVAESSAVRFSGSTSKLRDGDSLCIIVGHDLVNATDAKNQIASHAPGAYCVPIVSR